MDKFEDIDWAKYPTEAQIDLYKNFDLNNTYRIYEPCREEFTFTELDSK